MSQGGKIALWVVVILIVVGGIWLWVSNGAPAANNSYSQNGAQTTSGQTASATDTSDQSINHDMASVSAGMQALGSDTANISSSMNDQSINQSF